MPATTVHVGLGLVVGAALLGAAYDRRALALLVVALVLPDLDAIPGWWLPGAHRALGHNLLLPAALAGLLYYDVRVRERSWLRERWGQRAVQLVGVALLAHVGAHLLLDWAHLDGINLLYPVGDQFYRLEGELALSTTDGLVQTFVEFGSRGGVDVGSRGSTSEVHVATPADPEPGGGVDPDTERVVPIAVGGWQLFLLAFGPLVLLARRLQSEPPASATNGVAAGDVGDD